MVPRQHYAMVVKHVFVLSTMHSKYSFIVDMTRLHISSLYRLLLSPS